MVNEANKHPLNVSGKYYVLCSCCLDHECCVETAPNNFRMGEDLSAYVFNQPASADEEARCRRALDECPVEAIRDDGEIIP
jgi:ferredoxin